MEGVTRYLENVEPRTAALFTGAACMIGTVVVLLQKGYTQREAKAKIQKAQNRRTDSLQRAEHAVLQYNKSHPETDSALILTLSLSELTKKLQEGSLNPEEVFYSYMEKTLDLNKDLNCCTGILLESFDQMKTLDSNRKGLLYGVPVSIKEIYGYKNYDSSCGVTLNPHNPLKTSGGSSGGEGALIGGGGSLLGMGSDIGGSIRLPASFCGVCGFKPTPGRLSSQGLSSIYRGQKIRRCCVTTCSLWTPLSHPCLLMADLPELQTSPDRLPRKRRLHKPSPSMARNVREVKALLEAAGHTLVPYRHLNLEYAIVELVVKGILADGATTLLQKLEGSAVDPSLKAQIAPLFGLPLFYEVSVEL
ncbi:hypothetical protein KUCAC02_023377, partial [Chaenocephalus aceratus]